MRNIYCSINNTEKRIAIVEDGKLAEVMIEREGEEDIVGNIYMGRVENIVKGMNAAFVNISLEKNAYLHSDDMPENLLQGQYILVQVKKNDANGKGARVTCKIEFTGKYIVYMPYDPTIAPSKKIKSKGKWVELGRQWCSANEGILFRSACENSNEDEVGREFQSFQELFLSLTKEKKKPALVYAKHSFVEKLLRVYPKETISYAEADSIEAIRELKREIGEEKVKLYHGKENIFSHYLLDIEIDKALKQTVPLQRGAFLLLEQLETMTIIDVNSGSFTGKENMENTAVTVNKLAIKEIARQLRLRNIGGMILIDFINMKEEDNKKEVMDTLAQELKKDYLYTKIYGFTKLGILEMTRKRTGKSLRETLLEKCPACQGTGFAQPQ